MKIEKKEQKRMGSPHPGPLPSEWEREEELVGRLVRVPCSCGIEGGVGLRRLGLVGFGRVDCAQMWSVCAGMRTDVAFGWDGVLVQGRFPLQPLF